MTIKFLNKEELEHYRNIPNEVKAVQFACEHIGKGKIADSVLNNIVCIVSVADVVRYLRKKVKLSNVQADYITYIALKRLNR